MMQSLPTPTDIVTVAIKSDGADMSEGYELLSVDIVQDYNRISYAELKLIDGDFAAQEYPISDSSYFDPGSKVVITLKYNGQPAKNSAVFEGIIIKHSLQKTLSGCVLSLSLSDAAVKMTTQRQNNIFTDISDSDLIAKLIGRYRGVSAGNISATKTQHERIVQFYTTDWDMLLSRAEVNGLLVAAVNGVVSAWAPSFGAAALAIEIGKDLVYDFDLQADARNQYEGVTALTWDPATHEIKESVAGNKISIEQGNLTASKLAAVMNNDNDRMISVVPLNTTEAGTWADARLLKTRLSMLKGTVSIAGTGALKLGDGLELSGIGKKFSGTTIITGLRHHVSGGNWLTTIQFGLSADWFSSAVQLTGTKAAGLLPGVNGLQIGIVQASNGDPEGQSRIKVTIPGMANEEKTLWARLATPDGGADRGFVFWPEEGDEVILGFINDDPRFPVILGSVYGAKNHPAVAQTETNDQKGWVTRSGMAMLFDDEKKTLTIKTSDDNKIAIDNENKTIEITDQNGNNLKLDEGGIMMKSAKNVTINAEGDIDIKGKNIKIKGSKIDLI